MGKSKYSRKTWTKRTQSASTSTSRLGSNGCSLCSDGSNPENLSAHVNDGQTCADVHLQLTMLRYDNAMCAVGQEKYQELCCKEKSSGDFNSTLGFMIGAVVAGFFLKKIFTIRKRRIRQETKIYDDEEIPGTVSFSSRSSRNSSRSDSTDLEMPSSRYVNMDEPKARSNRGKQGRHPSRSRDRPRVEHDHHTRLDSKAHSSSRSSGGRKENRSRDRSMSRSRPRDMPDTTRSNRDRPMSRSRARSHSRPRDMPADTALSNRDRPMSRCRARSHSRPRDMTDTTRSNRDRPVSRSRARSRSRPRDTVEQARSSRDGSRSRNRAQNRSRPTDVTDDHSRNRTGNGRSRSRSRARSRPDFEGVDLYHGDGDGPRFPTQVL
jgi:hypothetical protein